MISLNRNNIPYHALKSILFHLMIFSILGLICFPIFWAIFSSFKIKEDIFTVPLKILPSAFTLDHYKALWSTTEVPHYFINSFLVAIGTSLLTVVVASLAAYSLTRFPFPGIGVVARSVLFSYMLPPVLLSIPFFIMLNKGHLLNTRIGLLFCHTALSLPFVIWLFWGFFRTIPLDVEEAAKIDGSGRMRILIDIFFPLALPGIIAGSVFTFIVSWSDYLFASVIATKDAAKTLPVGIALIASRDFLRWELILSATGLIIVPVLIIMVFVQKYLLEGFSAPVVKG